MSNGNSIINLGGLAKPATVLIEKISDAIGGIFKPRQIRRVAQAEAEAEKVKAAAQIEITELHQRAIVRFFSEEAKKQANIEEITRMPLEDVEDNARPEDMENDWISNFFEKCRLISDEEIQGLWAKVLAGEANEPGKFSKRTVNFLSSIDKTDAIMFTKLCGYIWIIDKDATILIYDNKNELYISKGIIFSALNHLEDIGLLSFASIGRYLRTEYSKVITAHYYGKLSCPFGKGV